MQAKLDEPLRAVARARGEFIGIEHLTDKQIEDIRSALEKETTGKKGDKAAAGDTLKALLRRQ